MQEYFITLFLFGTQIVLLHEIIQTYTVSTPVRDVKGM